MYQKNAVDGQNANNFLKTTSGEMGCCGNVPAECQSTATYTQANSVSAITVEENGVDVPLPLTIAGAATAAQVKTAIDAALVAHGYYDDDNVDYPGIVVTDLGTTLEIVITGRIKVKTLTASGGTSTFDADCIKQNLCTFAVTGFTAGAGSTLHTNGSVQSLGTITPGTTTAADVKTAVEAALLAEGITAVATVTTTGSGGTQTYNVSIAAIPSNTTLYLVGASGVKFYLETSNCVQSYN